MNCIRTTSNEQMVTKVKTTISFANDRQWTSNTSCRFNKPWIGLIHWKVYNADERIQRKSK